MRPGWVSGLCVAVMVLSGPVAAQPVPPEPTTAEAPEQFYVLSFTDAPIAEVAEAVIGGALAEGLAIDPAVEGTMSFTAEGAFTRDGLLQEFGAATLDQDVALVRSRAGDLALVPRPNLAAELARGGALVSLAQADTAAPAPATATTVPIVYGAERWWDGPVGGLLIFLTGAVSGAGALYAGHRILIRGRRETPAPVLMIAHAPPVSAEPAREDPELTIPRFETRRRDS